MSNDNYLCQPLFPPPEELHKMKKYQKRHHFLTQITYRMLWAHIQSPLCPNQPSRSVCSEVPTSGVEPMT